MAPQAHGHPWWLRWKSSIIKLGISSRWSGGAPPPTSHRPQHRSVSHCADVTGKVLMNPHELSLWEENARKAYQEASDEARKVLMPYFESANLIPQCQSVLDNSREPIALLAASQALLQVITKHWNYFNPPQRLDIRNYMLNFLATRGPGQQEYVIRAVIQLICRITKLGWFDDEEHRKIAEQVTKFLQATSEHCAIGLTILITLIEELNYQSGKGNVTKHRRVMNSFRDNVLLYVFQLGLTTLRQLVVGSVSVSDPEMLLRLKDRVLDLVIAVLSFDFLGTSPDESADDVGSVQIPSSWRSTFEEPALLQVFFDFHAQEQSAPHGARALECLVLLASVRRSLFSSEGDRGKFLAVLVRGVGAVLRTRKGLDDSGNFHQLCRLLARLKANYQLSELVNADEYSEWIRMVAEFTASSFNQWRWASNSFHYLLVLWMRLVSSQPFLKGDAKSRLDEYAPQVLSGYVGSRRALVRALLAGESVDNPMDDEQGVADEMESLSAIGRLSYSQTAQILTQFFDPLFQQYQSLPTQSHSQTPAQLEHEHLACEGEMAWLVYVMGAVVGGRLGRSIKEDDDQIDGGLAARVFRLMALTDDRLAQSRSGVAVPGLYSGNEALECAYLYFFQQFRRSYVGDALMGSSKCYAQLGELLGMDDHAKILSFIVRKIATNLKLFPTSDTMVPKTLALFQELSNGYSSSKHLVSLDEVTFILTNHSTEFYAFLSHPSNFSRRSLFYSTLARLLYMDACKVPFESLVAPIDQVLTKLAGLPSIESFRSDDVKGTVIGTLRDLRGLSVSANSKNGFSSLFDWLYPDHFPVLRRVVEALADVPEVMHALLKFTAEFSHNRAQRLNFDPSSPNGILLFREVSAMLVAYGRSAATRPMLSSKPYEERYKAVSICLNILSRCVAGNYINFGVFQLYGDLCFTDALSTCAKLATAIPLDEILTFPKFCKEYITLTELLLHHHTNAILTLDPPLLTGCVSALGEAIKSFDAALCSLGCTALDHLCVWIFENARREPETPMARAKAARVANAVQGVRVMEANNPQLLPSMLAILLNMLVYEEVSNQWSISRPVFSLIITHPEVFSNLQHQLAASQPAENQPKMLEAFQKLMANVEPSVDQKNRDVFVRNVTLFRANLKTWLT